MSITLVGLIFGSGGLAGGFMLKFSGPGSGCNNQCVSKGFVECDASDNNNPGSDINSRGLGNGPVPLEISGAISPAMMGQPLWEELVSSEIPGGEGEGEERCGPMGVALSEYKCGSEWAAAIKVDTQTR